MGQVVEPEKIENAWEWARESEEDSERKIMIGVYLTPSLVKALDKKWRSNLKYHSRSEYVLKLILRDLMEDGAHAGGF